MDVRPLSPREIAHLSGLETLRGMIEGRLPAPPFAITTSIALTAADEGKVVFEGEPKAEFFNPLGSIHGGWTATIMDSVMACAVHSTLAPGEAYTTLEFKLHFCRPIMPATGRVRRRGWCSRAGGVRRRRRASSTIPPASSWRMAPRAA